MTDFTVTLERQPLEIAVQVISMGGGGGSGGQSFTFRTVTANATGQAWQALLVDATTGPITITAGTNVLNGQLLVIKTDATTHPVTVTGFDPLSTQSASLLMLNDGSTWRTLMAYTPGLGSVVANINALKQAAITASVTQAGSATPISAAFGTLYEITGSTNQTINLPASSGLAASTTGVVWVKCGPSYSGTITVSPASGTIDGAASFTMTGSGQQNIFEVPTSGTDWQVG